MSDITSFNHIVSDLRTSIKVGCTPVKLAGMTSDFRNLKWSNRCTRKARNVNHERFFSRSTLVRNSDSVFSSIFLCNITHENDQEFIEECHFDSWIVLQLYSISEDIDSEWHITGPFDLDLCVVSLRKMKLTRNVFNSWGSTNLDSATGSNIAHGVKGLARVFSVINFPNFFNDHDEERALVLLLFLKLNSSSLFGYFPSIPQPSVSRLWLSTHLCFKVKSLAQTYAAVVKASDKFWKASVLNFLNLDHI